MKKLTAVLSAMLMLTFSSFAGGFVIISGEPNVSGQPQMQQYTLQCRSIGIAVKISDQSAETRIDQVFYNNSNSRLEGYFLFPVPKGSIIKNFYMDINGQMMQAELLEAPKARKIYEDIVRSMRDPALLEYAEQDLFRVRIFPIEPNSEKRITISYSELLTKENGTLHYSFPLNTKKYSAAPLQNVSMKMDILASADIKTLYSPTHETEIIRKGNRGATVGYEAKNTNPDLDFEFYYNTSSSLLGTSFITYKQPSEDGFFFADISPGTIDENVSLPKDITLVLDVSGSMAGEKMEQAKEALIFCVENLNPGDCFEIIKFSTEAQALFGDRVPFNEANKKKALEFIRAIKPIGGTNMDEAFDLALQKASVSGRPGMIIFITDGKPTIGETDETRLRKKISQHNSSSQRIFTFGVGYDLNTKLLDQITEDGRGYRTYVTPDEDIEVKVSDFYTKVSSPVLSDIRISFADPSNTYGIFPKAVPDLFKGSSLTLFGRYRQPGTAKMKVEGKVAGKPVTFFYDLEFGSVNETHEFIAPLWATRNVGYLLDQIRLHGESQELKDEVVTLAKQYGIITPYTSYLILEDEQMQTVNRNIAPRDQLFAPRFDDANGFISSNRVEFEDMKSSSGKGSVRSSTEVQSLNLSTRLHEKKESSQRMVYRDKSGLEKNFSEETQNINGRAMYQKGTEWIDVNVQKNANLKVNRVNFGSREYFALIENDPGVSRYLAMGRNVRFVHNNNMYEIYE